MYLETLKKIEIEKFSRKTIEIRNLQAANVSDFQSELLAVLLNKRLSAIPISMEFLGKLVCIQENLRK
jgi:hypothetical protein